MTNWAQMVEGIGVSDDLHIAPFRADGTTYGTPTWIWSVVVDGRLFVRRGTVTGHAGTSPRWRSAQVASSRRG